MSAETNSFEIGLVMAGAVSAGAYSAGVVDFLLEALRNYEKVRREFAEDHPDADPLHKVTIPVVSGASAGGMTGTMLLSAMTDEGYRPLSNFDPRTVTPDEISHNVFYRSWVDKAQGVDIDYLLDTGDLQKGKPLKSLLNCTRLGEIAEAALAHPRMLQPWEYIPERIDLFLSVTNLNGVPYSVRFEGSGSTYGMAMHSDMMHFLISKEAVAPTPNEILLQAQNDAQVHYNWRTLKLSALATGAFPIALEARRLEKEKAGYDYWNWWVPQSDAKGKCREAGRCFGLTTIPPTWDCEPKNPYSFLSVDGGVTNNEPLEVSRRTLAGDRRFNPRDKDKADKAVIMIDPFPAVADPSHCDGEESSLAGTALKLFGALKSQARFKPEELEMAADTAIFSRFMVAPSRDGAAKGQELACASVGAFGGFLSEKFRQHDFQLGRRNCQSFLAKHFVIGKANPLVSGHYDWFKANGCVVERNGEEYIQIVPMAGRDITREISPVDYGSIKMEEAELDAIIRKISRRIKRAVDVSRLIESLIDDIAKKLTSLAPLQWAVRGILSLFKTTLRNFLADKAAQKIEGILRKDLEKRHLIH